MNDKWKAGRQTSALVMAMIVGLVGPMASAHAADDVVFADFEQPDYGAWQVEGTAFGSAPAEGKLAHQMPVDGFLGRGLVNSFAGGDGSKGRLLSPEFRIVRPYIGFRIGGGGWKGETCLNLLVDNKPVRSATGPNLVPGGRETLEPAQWDVRELNGKTARLEIVDQRGGGWGHINVDHIVFTDKPLPKILPDATREVVLDRRLLLLPVTNGGTKRVMRVVIDGESEQRFDIELADAKPDWWATLDVAASKGRRAKLIVERLPESSQGLELVRQADEPDDAGTAYHEPLRPQFHFSPRRGWNNDPNGLSYFRGEYHLFFQHNPYGTQWGNMHWGHAISKDLVHWRELDETLCPDRFGPMFSGSAVVDRANTSRLGSSSEPALVLLYTAAGRPTTQCLASTTDGRSFRKLESNPVLGQITPGNRDPKVFWHAPSGHWVMVLYVGREGRHTIEILKSPDLRTWTSASTIAGGKGDDKYLYECPDMFELAVDGDASRKKWVVMAADSQYAIGTFDGHTFEPEASRLPGHRGQGFYAAQTFSDEPAGRRVQIGWLQARSPGMAFNQCMSLPLELSLRSTSDGPRLVWQPVKELERLRTKSWHFEHASLLPGDANPLADVRGELLELRATFNPTSDAVVALEVRGVPIRFDARSRKLSIAGRTAQVPAHDGAESLTIFLDRTTIEVFATGGLLYAPMPIIADEKRQDASLSVERGSATAIRLDGHQLGSSWD